MLRYYQIPISNSASTWASSLSVLLAANALLRGFSNFQLFAENPNTGQFDMQLYEISPTNPYGNTPEPPFTLIDRNPGSAHPSVSLAFTANVFPNTARRFRAEFVQFGSINANASGPRIRELKGFDTFHPDIPPVPEPSGFVLTVSGLLGLLAFVRQRRGTVGA